MARVQQGWAFSETGQRTPKFIDSQTGQPWVGGPNDVQPAAKEKAQTKIEEGTLPIEAYAPGAAQRAVAAYDVYTDSLNKPLPVMGDIVGDFKKNAPDYEKFDWKMPETELPDYEKFDFQTPEYTAQKGKAFDFNAPQIEDIQDVSGVPSQVWQGLRAEEEGRIGKGFEGQREGLNDYLARTGGEGRSGQRAALLTKLGAEEENQKASARRQIAAQQAMQELQVAQGTQALKAGRGTAQAGFDIRAQENEAQELARAQGIDIDEARYIVEQKRKTDEANAGEGRYGYEAATNKAINKQGNEWALQENQAGENEKGYKAGYGKAQDTANLEVTKYGADVGTAISDRQGRLSGAQLGQGLVGNIGSYKLQKEGGDDKDLASYEQAASSIGTTAGTAAGYGAGGGFKNNLEKQIVSRNQKSLSDTPQLKNAYPAPSEQQQKQYSARQTAANDLMKKKQQGAPV